MKKTKWFPANVKPVHEGNYEVRGLGWNFTATWKNGAWWLVKFNETDWTRFLNVQEREWRGLAEKPE